MPDPSSNSQPANRSVERPSRRQVIGGIGAGAAVAWTAPTVVSMSAAAAASNDTPPPPPPLEFRLLGIIGGPAYGTSAVPEPNYPRGTLVEIDPAAGTVTPLAQLANPGGADGTGAGDIHMLATDGTDLFHFNMTQMFRVDASFSETSIPLSGAAIPRPPLQVARWNGSTFIASDVRSDNDGEFGNWLSISTTGVVTVLGANTAWPHSMPWSPGLTALEIWGGSVYGSTFWYPTAPGRWRGSIATLNPATGAAINVEESNAPGDLIWDGFIGLTTHPTTAALWFVARYSVPYDINGNSDTLEDYYYYVGTIDPDTGAVANVVKIEGARYLQDALWFKT